MLSQLFSVSICSSVFRLIQISSKGEVVVSTSNMFINEEYWNMHFVYVFCNGYAAAAERDSYDQCSQDTTRSQYRYKIRTEYDVNR